MNKKNEYVFETTKSGKIKRFKPTRKQHIAYEALKKTKRAVKALIKGETFKSLKDDEYRTGKRIGNVELYRNPNLSIEDATDEFVRKKTRKTNGSVTYDINLNMKKHKSEKETAEWLANKFGANIKVLQENTEKDKNGKPKQNVSYVDLEWDRKIWEVKAPSSLRAIDNRLREAYDKYPKLNREKKKKYEGVVLNLNEKEGKLNDVSDEDIITVAKSRTLRSSKQKSFVIIKRGNRLVKVLKVDWK